MEFLRSQKEGQPEEESQQAAIVEHARLSKWEGTPVGTPEETLLKNREKKASAPLAGGINQAVFITLKDDGSGVFKPKDKEWPELRRHVEAGTYLNRERAAYIVDRFLGLDLVPPTVLREIDGKIGSFQRFVADAVPAWGIPYGEFTKHIMRQQLMKLWIFDYIIHNSDRHGGNFLIRPGENKLYAIDNGLSFGNDRWAPYRDFFDDPIPLEIAESIGKFLSWKEGKKICEDLLRELLDSVEVEHCMRRIEKIGSILKNYGRIPKTMEGELTF